MSPSNEPRVGAVGIGVQKSATSWLFRRLEQHPEVGSATRRDGSSKEINFFNHHYHRGFDWYESLFPDEDRLNLEFSVLYFCDADVPSRLARYNPEARLILALRDPVERAWSQHRHEVAHGRVADAGDFARALERNPSYLDQGRYGSHLERWLSHFSLEQIRVVDYGDVRDHPERVVRSAYQFLGVDPDFVPGGLNERTYVTRMPVNEEDPDLVRGASQWLRRAMGGRLHRRIRRSALAGAFRRLRSREHPEVEIPSPAPELLLELREEFDDEIRRLEVLTGRSFSHWRRGE